LLELVGGPWWAVSVECSNRDMKDGFDTLGHCSEIWAADLFTPIYRMSRVAAHARGECETGRALPARHSARCSGRVLRVTSASWASPVG
jgi:hypothetical protein